MASWMSRLPPGRPNGFLGVQISSWTSKWPLGKPPGRPNGLLGVQMASWTSKWLPERPNGRLSRPLSIQITFSWTSKWRPGRPNGFQGCQMASRKASWTSKWPPTARPTVCPSHRPQNGPLPCLSKSLVPFGPIHLCVQVISCSVPKTICEFDLSKAPMCP